MAKIKSFNEWRDEVELFYDRMPLWYWNSADRIREYDNYVYATRKRINVKRIKKAKELFSGIATGIMFYAAILLVAYLLTLAK